MRRLMAAAGTTALLGLAAIPAHASASSATPSQRHQGPATTTGAGGSRIAQALPGDIAYLNTTFNLQPYASGRWVNTPLQVTLPRAGRYHVDVNVQGRLWGAPPTNLVILARLADATTGTVLYNTTRLVDHLVDMNPWDRPIGQRATASIDDEIRVTRPTRIVLQATRLNQAGTSSVAEILPGPGGGRTSFRFERVGP
jgi:hypothetical protein